MANQNHFELTLDTIAPTGSITRAYQYGKVNADMAVNVGDASFVKYWFTTSPTGTDQDANYPSEWTPVVAGTTAKVTDFTADGQYYYHMQLMDSVDNKSPIYNTEIMNFDTTKPVVTDNTAGQKDHLYIFDVDSNDKDYTNDKQNKIHFEFSDPGQSASGPVSYRLNSTDFDADVTGQLVLGDNGVKEVLFSFKDDVADGTKTVNVYVSDAAGNESLVKSATITLDRQQAEATLKLTDSEGNVIGEQTNANPINAEFVSTDTDIVGFKVWTGDTEPDTWVDPSDTTKYPIELTLPEGDGNKTIHAAIIDQAGTVTQLTDATIILDQTDPTVDLVTDKAIISNVSGFNTAVLTLTGTDSGSGVASYSLKCGATEISGANTAPPTSFNLTSANSMVEGDNTITLEVIDNAGNSDSSTVTVKLDTIAPTGTIGTLNTWYNAAFPITVTSSDGTGTSAGAGVDRFYAWTSTTATDTTVPSGATSIQRSSDSQEIATGSISFNPTQSADNYMHIQTVDAVGNVSYDHKKFGYDSVAPEKPVIKFGETAYASTSANVTITASDATSGLTLMQVTGDIQNPTAAGAWEEFSSTRSVTLTIGDGMKSIYVKVKDAAGNESPLSDADETELDTTTPSGSLVLRNPGTTAAKDNPSNNRNVDLYIEYTDDSLGGGTYKITGDFTESPKEGTITPAEGTTSFTVPLVATAADGDKNFTVVLTDNASHTYSIPTQTFRLDTAAPVVTIDGVDYNIISKVNEFRIINGTVTDDYADEVHFRFFIDNGSGEVSSEDYINYKVCAYASRAAAEAGSHADAAVPSTGGSLNMTGTGKAHVAVNAMIKGADLETAAGSENGVKIVVAYMQDAGGTWSEAASFSVTQG